MLFYGLSVLFYSCKRKESADMAYIRLANSYDTVGLKTLLSEDFVIERTYSTYKNDLVSFLRQYIPNAESANGKMHVIDRKLVATVPELIVRNSSDIFSFLQIVEPEWKLRFYMNETGKINKLVIDTTEAYHSYSMDVDEKEDRFEHWLNLKYPGESIALLVKSKEKLKARLREYRDVAKQ